MTVRIGDMTFTDWVSLSYAGGWTDTFIFRISAQACIPPFPYATLLKRIVTHLCLERSSASIWVQVDSPGEWFVAEMRRSLRGLKLPYAVTRDGEPPDYLAFSFRPGLFHSPVPRPPIVDHEGTSIPQDELRCLQALARIEQGHELEIASLTGLAIDLTRVFLADLMKRKLLVYEMRPKIPHVRSKPKQIAIHPDWYIKHGGRTLALRSWGVPRGVSFAKCKEENLTHINTIHRHIARLWPAWLKSAWPQAEIWAGWSEVRIPGLHVIPDGLAWGKVQGYEALFWLEVGDGHKGSNQIIEITRIRLARARELCERTGVRLVYTQLSTDWVHEAARWACVDLSNEVAVVMGNIRRFGGLPMLEWGRMVFEK